MSLRTHELQPSSMISNQAPSYPSLLRRPQRFIKWDAASNQTRLNCKQFHSREIISGYENMTTQHTTAHFGICMSLPIPDASATWGTFHCTSIRPDSKDWQHVLTQLQKLPLPSTNSIIQKTPPRKWDASKVATLKKSKYFVVATKANKDLWETPGKEKRQAESAGSNSSYND